MAIEFVGPESKDAAVKLTPSLRWEKEEATLILTDTQQRSQPVCFLSNDGVLDLMRINKNLAAEWGLQMDEQDFIQVRR